MHRHETLNNWFAYSSSASAAIGNHGAELDGARLQAAAPNPL
jgi:hypothetical protein